MRRDNLSHIIPFVRECNNNSYIVSLRVALYKNPHLYYVKGKDSFESFVSQLIPAVHEEDRLYIEVQTVFCQTKMFEFILGK